MVDIASGSDAVLRSTSIEDAEEIRIAARDNLAVETVSDVLGADGLNTATFDLNAYGRTEGVWI